MNLLIVESPIQAHRIASFLPESWRVEASRGHLRDLPIDALGIDIKHDFALQYRVVPDHFGTLHRLQKAARDADTVYLGTSPDREGETIAAHLAELLKDELKDKRLHRVTFSAVTPAAVLQAIANPRQIDSRLVEAQQTRRTLDRLVGYLLSPLASRVLKASHSIGRVQMAALWLLAERAMDIQTFKAQPYWTLEATFQGDGSPALTAQLSAVYARCADRWSHQTVQNLAATLQHGCAYIDAVTVRTEGHTPQPPFTTAALLHTACEALHLTAEQVMALAHALYEQGFITHPRTDAVYVPPEAQENARAYISEKFGAPYVPVLPPVYLGKLPETHEAIRPTTLTHLPETLPPGEGRAVYALIWQRFLASQMVNAQVQVQTVTLQLGEESGQRCDVFLTARTERCTVDGFQKIVGAPLDDDAPMQLWTVGQRLYPSAVKTIEHVAQPSTPYTDSTLIAALEHHGIGRPATYASTLKLLIDKGYLTRDHGVLVLTAHAKALCTFLARHFPEPFVADFTARLERQLDQIAAGETTRVEVLRGFWQTFTRSYRPLAAVFLPDNAARQPETPVALGVCPQCGGQLVAHLTKTGGQFAGCEHFPTCAGRAAPVRFSAVAKAGR